jgi:hypothetical protein
VENKTSISTSLAKHLNSIERLQQNIQCLINLEILHYQKYKQSGNSTQLTALVLAQKEKGSGIFECIYKYQFHERHCTTRQNILLNEISAYQKCGIKGKSNEWMGMSLL